MSVLAIVPARRGSKSVPDKNVASFRGRPLLVHSIEHGLLARNVDRVLVSTDSPRYREIALAAGAEAPFLRPEALAGDLSTDLEVFATPWSGSSARRDTGPSCASTSGPPTPPGGPGTSRRRSTCCGPTRPRTPCARW
jgi:CMP-N-acetylneuraminic acid synthetase